MYKVVSLHVCMPCRNATVTSGYVLVGTEKKAKCSGKKLAEAKPIPAAKN